jgi:hypothetical protein
MDAAEVGNSPFWSNVNEKEPLLPRLSVSNRSLWAPGAPEVTVCGA